MEDEDAAAFFANLDTSSSTAAATNDATAEGAADFFASLDGNEEKAPKGNDSGLPDDLPPIEQFHDESTKAEGTAVQVGAPPRSL